MAEAVELCWDCREVKAYADSHQCLDCFDAKYTPDSYWDEHNYQHAILEPDTEFLDWEAHKLLQELKESDDE